MHTELGKIRKASFGYGGYQDCQIVFSFELGGEGWGTTQTFECGWCHVSKEELEKPGSSYKWTHESRIKQIGEKAYEVFQIIRDAKKKSLDELEGVPIRAYFDSPVGRIIKFEILKEVL